MVFDVVVEVAAAEVKKSPSKLGFGFDPGSSKKNQKGKIIQGSLSKGTCIADNFSTSSR